MSCEKVPIYFIYRGEVAHIPNHGVSRNDYLKSVPPFVPDQEPRNTLRKAVTLKLSTGPLLIYVSDLSDERFGMLVERL